MNAEMQTEGIGQPGLDHATDFRHFPDCDHVELDGWPVYSANNHAFQTNSLSDIWSNIQPGVVDQSATPGLSSLDNLSSFEVCPPVSNDVDVTGDDVSTALPNAFKLNATPFTSDTFSYFYGSEYNPFSSVFHDIGHKTVTENHSMEHTSKTVSHTKPSYSDIAKSTPSVNHSKKSRKESFISESSSVPVSEPVSVSGPDRTSKSSTWLKSHPVKHVPFDPLPINPDSAYGLDTFVTPRYTHKDKRASQSTHKDRHGLQCSGDTFVHISPARRDSRPDETSLYHLDSFDAPPDGVKEKHSSLSKSAPSPVDNVSENHFDVNDFYQMQSCNKNDFNDFRFHSDDRRQKVHPSNLAATLNGTRARAEDNEVSSHDRRQSWIRTKSSQSASKSTQSADTTRGGTFVLNNSKPTSSASRPRSVAQINNNVRDNKVNGKTHNTMQNDSKVTDTAHRKNSVQDDNKVKAKTRSSRWGRSSKASKKAKTTFDYLKLMEQLHGSCERAGQYLSEVLCKSTITVMALFLVIVKYVFHLAVHTIVCLVMVSQSLVKKVLEYCYLLQQRWIPSPASSGNSTQWPPAGSNIELPTTGDVAVKRLLNCDVSNPYRVLGVSRDASDEEMKRFYRKQAILVHPDKNHQVGSEEAFKILQNAFDIISDPEKRQEFRRSQETAFRRSQEKEAAVKAYIDKLNRLRKEMKEAANRLICDRCRGTHLRVLTDRCLISAHYCSSCKQYHPAKENDLWAETGFSFHYVYFACMDGYIYNITEWALCQGRLCGLEPNLHRVQVHLRPRPRNRAREEELDELLKQLDPSNNNHRPRNSHPNFPDNAWKPKSRKRNRKRRT